MVRFKVIKGSHLLLIIAVIILIAVSAFILLQSGSDSFFTASESAADSTDQQIDALKEAKAISAFASQNYIAPSLKIEVIADKDVPSLEADAPHILIYHTHTHEAYQQNSSEPYEAIETWRTADAQYSVVRVGAALADELKKQGFRVTHDTTDHERDSLGDSYVRSLKTLEGYAERGIEFDLCIDLHRDAYTEGLSHSIEYEGVRYAQLMLLVGRGDAYEEALKPDYAGNLSFAQYLTGILNASIPGLCRNVTVKQGRYNQHLGKTCILVEVGHNLNTLEQALSSVAPLAKALKSTMRHFY